MNAKINSIEIYTIDCQGALIEDWRMKNHTNHWSPTVLIKRGADYVEGENGEKDWTWGQKSYYNITISSLLRLQRAQVEIAKRHAQRVFVPEKASQ